MSVYGPPDCFLSHLRRVETACSRAGPTAHASSASSLAWALRVATVMPRLAAGSTVCFRANSAGLGERTQWAHGLIPVKVPVAIISTQTRGIPPPLVSVVALRQPQGPRGRHHRRSCWRLWALSCEESPVRPVPAPCGTERPAHTLRVLWPRGPRCRSRSICRVICDVDDAPSMVQPSPSSCVSTSKQVSLARRVSSALVLWDMQPQEVTDPVLSSAECRWRHTHHACGAVGLQASQQQPWQFRLVTRLGSCEG